MEELFTTEGTVHSLIFQNPENGYTVLRLVTEEGEAVTVVGCIPCAAAGEGMTVTSAMKGLAPTVKHLLSEVLAGNFANYGGKIDTLGLVSADPEENYVQLPTASTQFEDGKFTQADYEALVAAMFAGEITVSNDITAMPAVTNVTVEDFGNLK